jgi:hypothetical protein
VVSLPEPAIALAPEPARFYDEIRRMLEIVRPRELEHVGVSFDNGGVDVTLRHAREADWSIDAMVDSNGAVVHVGPVAHEHFDADEGGRPWAMIAVDYIAELLRGEIEIETEYRGRAVLRARQFLVDPDGHRHELSMTGLLRPALLMFWKPTRTDVKRVTYGAEG